MPFQLEEAIAVLERTPNVLRAALENLSDAWVMRNYGEATFSPYDVVGHLIHGERTDWMVRLRWIIERGESEPFEPFDRYAMYEQSKGKSMEELLETFARLRADNLNTLRSMNLTDNDFVRRGMHPALGPVTLGQLLATWVVHDLNHIHQIAKSMAHQYRDDVGPWKRYLSILPAK